MVTNYQCVIKDEIQNSSHESINRRRGKINRYLQIVAIVVKDSLQRACDETHDTGKVKVKYFVITIETNKPDKESKGESSRKVVRSPLFNSVSPDKELSLPLHLAKHIIHWDRNHRLTTRCPCTITFILLTINDPLPSSLVTRTGCSNLRFPPPGEHLTVSITAPQW